VRAERLSAQDATLWWVQARHAPLQIGALCMFEAGPLRDDTGALRIDDLRRRIECRLGDAPRFRSRLASAQLGQGLAWVDDEAFDIRRHVRAAAVPQPGGDVELRDFVRHLLEVPLDSRRPMWEIWIVEGLAGDRVAVIPKVSHVMADGMAVLGFALSTLDSLPDASPPPSPPPWTPAPPPDRLELLAQEMTGRLRLPVAIARDIAAGLRRPDRVVRRAVDAIRAAATTDGPAPALPITRPVGPHRDFAWVALPIDDLIEVKSAHRATLNDVALTVVTGALRRYLARQGQRLDVAPRALIPASTHTTAEDEIENRFSMMTARLPVDVADPVDRLRRIHVDMDHHKASSQADIGPVLFTVGSLVPGPLLRLVGPAVLDHQPFVNLAITNLPGTREPLYLLGAKMLELFPFVTVTGNIALIIGVLSYGDILGVGVTVDSDVVPDVDRFVADLGDAARELVDASRAAEVATAHDEVRS
jgi:diacylglycerol O-acyltransferase / wax synthase